MAIERQTKIDILLSSNKIKDLLRQRFNELTLSNKDVVNESKKYIKGLSEPKLSLYFNKSQPVWGYPTQKHLLYLCTRYCISLRVTATKEIYQEDKAIYNTIKTFANEKME